MKYATLVSTETLAAHLDDPSWVVFDCRHDLEHPAFGPREYAKSHIPGARFMHVDEDLSGPTTGRNGRHPLPDPRVFMRKLGAAGVDRAKQVVAYDAHGGTFAARAWWMLRWVGHDAVAVLDGGFGEWLREDHPETSEVPRPAPTTFDGAVRARPVGVDFVAAHLRDPGILLVDARGAERYTGATEPLDPVAGHIPGSVNVPFKENLAAGGVFKSADALRALWQPIVAGRDAASVVHTCGSGVSACHNLLAMEIAGLAGSRLYAGSWSEWCADPARPVATGPTP
ncbi:MAG: sulfurtransferase [Burkholderiales bacterium]|nr:sulfurtransferase [Burkholderiales bacterium]